ncbi:formylglycine-generating enzyme family protein [Kordiimonas pumila]|uniref:Formylglycine-generating enzyme family protein n=1 Tax=Kordiimonas pumila TaxID=2161677 RepID=A0ABV7D3J4_9PROT|nr:SUMF1/EgtB/PvdO family nonheme iron enzyme [Kordiimonas pumila]
MKKIISFLFLFCSISIFPTASPHALDTDAELQIALEALDIGRFKLADNLFQDLMQNNQALPVDISYHAARAAYGSGFYQRAEMLINAYLAEAGEKPLFAPEAAALKAKILEAISAFTTSEKAAFEFAQKQHTIFAYAAYRRQYPTGENVESADFLSFRRAKELNTEVSFLRYLEHWPDGKFVIDATNGADVAAMRVARQQNTIPSYQNYLDAYPKGKFRDQAKQHEEALAFYSAQKSGSVTALKNFLSVYATSLYRGEAEKALKLAEQSLPLYTLTGPVVRIPAGFFTYKKSGIGQTITKIDGNIIPKAFEATAYEITFSQWDKCVEAGGCNAYVPNDMGWGRMKRPVINVNKNDIASFIEWLNNEWQKAGGTGFWRLPSEVEWAYMVRGQNAQIDTQRAAFSNAGGTCAECADMPDLDMTFPVGQYKPNTYGLYDTLGNVAEWVADCWQDDFTKAPANAAPFMGTDGTCDTGMGVVRGSMNSAMPALLAAQARHKTEGTERRKNIGFRLVRSIPE